MGSKAVTGIGAASVIHQMIIHAAMPTTFQASGDIQTSGENDRIRKKTVGPNNSPKIFAPLNSVVFKFLFCMTD